MVPTAIEDKKPKLQGKDNEVLLSSLYHPLLLLFTSYSGVPIFPANAAAGRHYNAARGRTPDYFLGVDDYPMCKHRWQISAIW